eukprot:3576756-Amphidinium_carterae.1
MASSESARKAFLRARKADPALEASWALQRGLTAKLEFKKQWESLGWADMPVTKKKLTQKSSKEQSSREKFVPYEKLEQELGP